ncbi:tetratricopeptide repeat protein [Streptomyces sp. NPDC059534]|uniref:tetratricopeptide repeat protein n=1 Tax=Streptomyces sp. NPDC059534 TaxID=3346859 RepID=UPI003699F1C7
MVAVSEGLLDAVAGFLVERDGADADSAGLVAAVSDAGVDAGAGAEGVAQALITLGIRARDGRDLPRAERLFALAGEVAADAEDAPLWVRARTLLGGLHRIQGRYGEGEEVLRGALAVADGEPGMPLGPLVGVCNQLGILFKYSGKFVEAEVFYRRALLLLEEGDLGEDPAAASLFHNLSGLAHSRGDFAAAVEPGRRAIAVRERALGPDHLEVALDKAALAPVLIELDELEEAEALLTSALAVVEETYGPEHYETGIAVGNLAALAYRRGQYARAQELFRRCLRLKERALGPAHPELAVTLNNLAILARRNGDPDGAGSLWGRALAVLHASVQPGHPLLAAVRRGLDSLAPDVPA